MVWTGNRTAGAALPMLARGIRELVEVATAGTAVDTNAQVSGVVDITATASFTLNNPTGGEDGQRLMWRIWNNSGAAITVTLGDQLNYGGKITSIPAMAAGGVAVIGAIYRTLGGVTKWDVVAADAF